MEYSPNELFNRQLERFEKLLHNWAGQWFPDSRRTELIRALKRSVEKYGNGDTEAFLSILENSPSPILRDSVVQEILVGETYFFRDQALWTNLEEIILPDIVNHKINTKSMRIWSAGCSTGEEPYSLALVLQQAVTAIDSWKVSILATDISELSLSKARIGMYGQRAIRELDDNRWKNWYYRYKNGIQMKESIKSLINFQQSNLSDINFPDLRTMNCDLIICRNVLIYFDRDLVRKVIEQFGRCLSPNGWLILAPTEIPLDPPKGLKVQTLPHNFAVLRPQSAQMYSSCLELSYINTQNNSTSNFSLINSQNLNSAENSNIFSAIYPNIDKNISMTFAQGSSVYRLIKAKQDRELAKKSNDSNKSSSPHTVSNASTNPIATPSSNINNPPHTSVNYSSDSTNNIYNEFMEKYRLAQEQANRGKLHEALVTANKCVKLDNTCAEGWILLAIIQEELKLYNKSLESLNRALYLDRSIAVAHLLLARVQYRLGSNDIVASLKYFIKLTEGMLPDNELPNGGGLTIRDGRLIADQLSNLIKRNAER